MQQNKSMLLKEGNDIIYYNIEMTGKFNSISTPAVFIEDRTQNILDNASDYYMSVVRFSIDGSLIPIFVCPVIPNPDEPDPAHPIDMNYTPFIVTLQTATASYSQHVRYVPESNVTPLPNPPTVQYGQDFSNSYYYVYTYTRFIAMVNQAIQVAFNNLVIAEPAFVGSFAPSFTFDSVTRLITLHVTAVDGINTPFITPFVPLGNQGTFPCGNSIPNYNQNAFVGYSGIGCATVNTLNLAGNEPVQPPPANKIYFYMNEQLFSYFDALETFTYYDDPIKTQLFICRPFINNLYVGTNPPNPLDPQNNTYFYTQQYNISSTWNSLQSIVFLTQSIPVQPEYIPNSAIVTNTGSFQTTAKFRPIITDFVPTLEEAGSTRSRFVYYPSGQFRLIDLQSQLPLRKIDISIYWQDQLGNLFPVFISYNESDTIKLMFIRKSLANYNYKYY